MHPSIYCPAHTERRCTLNKVIQVLSRSGAGHPYCGPGIALLCSSAASGPQCCMYCRYDVLYNTAPHRTMWSRARPTRKIDSPQPVVARREMGGTGRDWAGPGRDGGQGEKRRPRDLEQRRARFSESSEMRRALAQCLAPSAIPSAARRARPGVAGGTPAVAHPVPHTAPHVTPHTLYPFSLFPSPFSLLLDPLHKVMR